jgi:hypothetical protein
MQLTWSSARVLLCCTPCQVPMPPALAASSRPQQDFDYDYERQVTSTDASSSFDSFLAKSEVRMLQSCAAEHHSRHSMRPSPSWLLW